ncbi:MAG: hypothetical protein KDA38_08215 [Planctomycetales bacterium]|nr:hypothetical protein [Planctomycetales bacterium]
MFAPFVFLVVGQLVPPPALVPAGPAAPLQPTLAEPSLAGPNYSSDYTSSVRIGGQVVQTPLPAAANIGEPAVRPIERSVLATSNSGGTIVTASSESVSPLTSTVDTPVTVSPAAKLIRDAWRKADEGGAVGEPTSLLTVLERTATNSQRREVVDAYWRLAIAAASYGWAVDALWQASQIGNPATEQGRLRLRADRAVAAAVEREAKMQLEQAQLRLAQAAQLSDAERMPLPSDLPYVGRYSTRLENFSAETVPAEWKEIDRLLPEQRELIEQWADAALASDEANAASTAAFGQQQLSLGELLAIRREVRDARTAFLQSVFRYNDDIARYAFSFAAEGLPATTIVSMLIPTEPRSRSVLVSPTGVSQASALEPVSPTASRRTGAVPGFRELP